MNVQVRKFLKELHIEQNANDSEFSRRTAKKITATNFIISFLLIFSKPNFSFRQWTLQLSLHLGDSVSFQALGKRCNSTCVKFVESLLATAIQSKLQSAVLSNTFTKQFGRLLLEDSTTFRLSNSMLKIFSGAGNKNSDVAMCKSHFCYDLLTMNALSYKVTKINENDASQSANILEYLKENDLILRDMGYLSNKILGQIASKGAFYISKVKDNYKYYNPEDDSEFDLAKALAKANRQGEGSFVKELIIGKRNKLKGSIIAVRLTADQVAKRKKKYQKKNGKKKQMSKSKKQLLHWSIIVTNIDTDRIDVEQIFNLYRLRWQIELLFKTWKSRFGIDSILKSYTGNDPNKVLILFYLSLLYCTAIFSPLVKKYKKIVKEKHHKDLSIQKFASVVINHLYDVCKGGELIELLIVKQACHEQCPSKSDYHQIISDFKPKLS